MIPKIIHQIWIGPNSFPSHVQDYCTNIKNIFHDYEYKFWNNDNLPTMSDKCVRQFDRYGKRGKYAFQADILRYYIMNTFGGIYLDVDFICNKRFDHLIQKPFFCVTPNNNFFHVCNGIFACTSNNPILTRLLKELRDDIYHGPLYFTKHISNFIGVSYGTHIYNYLENNPSDFIECSNAKHFFTKTGYCFHDALKSWLPRRNKKQ